MVRRVDLKHLAEISDGLVFVAFLLVCVAPVVVGDGIIRVERDRLGVVRDGAVERALRLVGEAPNCFASWTSDEAGPVMTS